MGRVKRWGKEKEGVERGKEMKRKRERKEGERKKEHKTLSGHIKISAIKITKK